MQIEALIDHPTRIRVCPEAITTLKGVMRSLREVLECLDTEVYRSSPSRVSGSVGGHVRHCLDHAGALVSATSGLVVDYDARRRGTRVEIDPSAAIEEIDRLGAELDRLHDRTLERVIDLHLMTDVGHAPVRLSSTIGREVAFVIQHTIHHCAIVAILLDRAGVTVPDRFGYAPSTPGPH